MFCSKCKSNAIIYLPYSKTHLCEGHFRGMFEKRFRATVREFSMIKKGERIAVALSGGKDSCVLLHCLEMLRSSLPFELVAITIDEGIKGYRNRTLEVARHEAKKLGIAHHIFSFKKDAGRSLDELMKEKKGRLPCTYCGVIRRRMLNMAGRGVGADKIAFGHNLDDFAQTVLMNIMRNEPIRLARLNEPLIQNGKFVRRIRPLMRAPEKEVAVYALINNIGVDFQECPYSGHAFRAHVRRQLNETEELYPGTKLRTVNSFFGIEKLLRKGLETENMKIRCCRECGEPASREVCVFCAMVEGV